jgi:small subunit ribosomal protein S20
MANTKSAKKRVLVSKTKHDRNRVVRSAVKTRITRVRRLVDGGEAGPELEVKAAISALDRAAERGIIHRNNAARRKSRLLSMVNKAAALAADPEAAAKAAADARAHAKGSGKATQKKGAAARKAKTTAAKATTGNKSASAKPAPKAAPKK